jgi:hypothetical protein
LEIGIFDAPERELDLIFADGASGCAWLWRACWTC